VPWLFLFRFCLIIFNNSLRGLDIDWACYSQLDSMKPGSPLSVDFSKKKRYGERLDVGQMMEGPV
jgi:hypothetical protein